MAREVGREPAQCVFWGDYTEGQVSLDNFPLPHVGADDSLNMAEVKRISEKMQFNIVCSVSS